MAKHRSRIQKQKSSEHRGRVRAPAVPTVQEVQVKPQPSQLTKIPTTVRTDRRPVSIPPMTQSLLRVDKSYLVADIRRSAIVSSILFAVLIGIFLLVRYNGLTRLQSQFYSITQATGK
jgi:hypothetical protein